MGIKVVELKPCPFCGSGNLDSESTISVRYIRCQNCSASGGHSFSHEEEWDWKTTIDRWNRRKGVKDE